MSSLGINSGVPLTGIAPSVTGVQPQPGAQAGSVEASGGVSADAFVRDAAVVATTAAPSLAAAARVAEAGRVIDSPSAAALSASGTAPAQPGAFDDAWAQRFKDAGLPSAAVQQLMLTGAMGADASKLKEMLAAATKDAETALSKFAHDHPEQFKKLRGASGLGKLLGAPNESDRAALVMLAQAVEVKQISKRALEEMADGAGKSSGRKAFDSIAPMAMYSIVPAWGLISTGGALANDGKDPLTGYKVFEDPVMVGISVLTAFGGAVALRNWGRSIGQVAKGRSLVAGGGVAANMALAGKAALGTSGGGIANLTGWKHFKSYLPGTHANKVLGGLSRRNDDLLQGMAKLKAGSLEQRIGQHLMSRWERGEIAVHGDPVVKYTMQGIPGAMPNVRGMYLGRYKPMTSVSSVKGTEVLNIDGRLVGKAQAPHFISGGADLVTGPLRDEMLALIGKSGHVGKLSAPDAAKLKKILLGNATNQLIKSRDPLVKNGSGYITAPTSVLAKLHAAIRPGPLQDALWAAEDVAKGATGVVKHGSKRAPAVIRKGAVIAAAGGAGYYMMVKRPSDLAKQDAAAAAAYAKKHGTPVAGQGTPGQPSAEQQAQLEQFAALPADQQAAIIEQQYTTLQQASQQPNLTADQQAEIVAAADELQLFMNVANGGASASADGAATVGGATDPGAGAPVVGAQPADPTASADPAAAGTSGFTAKGLGLA